MVWTILRQKIDDWIVRRLRSPNKRFQISGHIFDISVDDIVWRVRTDLSYDGINEGVFLVDSPDEFGYISRWIRRTLAINGVVVDISEESIGKM